MTKANTDTEHKISTVSVRVGVRVGLGYADSRGARPVRRRDAWPGLNRSALARKLGTSRSMVSRWLTGKVMPGLAHAGRVASELGMSLETLQLTLMKLRIQGKINKKGGRRK